MTLRYADKSPTSNSWATRLSMQDIWERIKQFKSDAAIESVCRINGPPAGVMDSVAGTGPSFSASAEHPSHLRINQLQALVNKTKGYYARDYSLGLGWNNVGVSTSLVTRLTPTLPAGTIYYRSSIPASTTPQQNTGDPILYLCTILRI